MLSKARQGTGDDDEPMTASASFQADALSPVARFHRPSSIAIDCGVPGVRVVQRALNRFGHGLDIS
jgi:hypothetical protein